MTRSYFRNSFILTLVFVAVFALADGVRANGIHAHHELEVTLFPAESRLAGVDNVRIKPAIGPNLEFSLADQATQISVAVNRKKRSFSFENGRLKLILEPQEQTAEVMVTIKYEAVFNDPVPVRPVNADNPGYGVTATISPKPA